MIDTLKLNIGSAVSTQFSFNMYNDSFAGIIFIKDACVISVYYV